MFGDLRELTWWANLFFVGLLVFVFGFGFLCGQNWSKPMYVLQEWRDSYYKERLGRLQCERDLRETKVKYLEDTNVTK